MYRRIIYVIAAVAVFAVAAGPALAAKGGNGTSGSTITLVTLGSSTFSAASTAGPAVGDNVTFDVKTAATDRPYILLNCYQGRTWVSTAQGFYSATNPPVFTLASPGWTSGAASCTARLGMLNADGTRFTDLAATTFSVSG